jgi:serine protease Do
MTYVKKNTTLGKFFITAVILSFLGGFLLASNLGCFSGEEKQEVEEASPAVAVSVEEQNENPVHQISQAFRDASLEVSPSVVSIIAEQEVSVSRNFGFPDDAFRDFFGDEFFRRFFGAPEQQPQRRTIRSLGSGVIVTEDGYILTNSHVVEKAEKLSVMIDDNTRYDAEVIGSDPPTDVAVIKIDAKGLKVATFGDSDNISVGQWVIAIGNPFQLMHTVTAGIISAKGRSSVGLAEYEDFIQTDASINPGNSGGALSNLNGNVIGINTAIASPTGGNIGIGFAIPANMAREVMDQLISKGRVVRGYMGVWLQDLTEELAEALDLKSSKGAIVSDIVADGPAAQAGMQRGDVIVKYNGQDIDDGTQLKNLVAQTDPGTSVKVVVIRDGEEKELTMKLGERQEEGENTRAQRKSEGTSSRKLGLDVQTLSPNIAQQLGYVNESGVVITSVISGSPASRAGLQRGDLIKEVDRKPVRTEDDFEKTIRSLQEGDVVALLVRRGQNTFFATLTIPQ